MANIDGLPVNSAVTHAEFISRTEDSSTTGNVDFLKPTQSTAATNGAIHTTGGAGVEKNLNVGENLGVVGTSQFTGQVNAQVISATGILSSGNINAAGDLNSTNVNASGVVTALGSVSTPTVNTTTVNSDNLNLTNTLTVTAIVTTGNATIGGDLTVNGTMTTVNSTTVTTVDPNITLNQGGSDATAEGSGITTDRVGTKGSIAYQNSLTSKYKAGDLGSEQEIVTVGHAQTLTNKTLTDAEINALVAIEQGSTPTTPTSGERKLYSKADGFYQLDSLGNETKVGSGSGSGGGAVNLITNGSADDAPASIFTPYLNTAQNRPVTGSGGAPTVTTSLTSTTPLSGTKSFLLTKPATNCQGQGWTVLNQTLPFANRAKSLKIGVEYVVNSGTFVAGNNSNTPLDGDVIWYLRDNTNNKLVEPSNIKMFASSTTVSDLFEAEVQFDFDCLNFSLIAHAASTSALAYELKVDSVTVSPQNYAYGTPVTEEVQFTPTFTGFGTVSGVECFINVIGGKAFIRGKFTSGTTTSVEARISIPYTVNPAYVLSLTEVGKGNEALSSATRFGGITLLAEPSAQYLTVGLEASSVSGVTKTNGNDHPNGAVYMFNAVVPILGGRATARMSDSYDARQIGFIGSGLVTTQGLVAAVTQISFNTVKDNTGMWSTNQAAIKSAGDYEVKMFIYTTAGVVAILPYVNGVVVPKYLMAVTSTGTSGTIILNDLKAGDVVSFRSNGNITIQADANNYISIYKLSGSQAIAASDKIFAKYTTIAGQSIPNNTETIVTFGTKAYDSHGSWNGTQLRVNTSQLIKMCGVVTFTGMTAGTGNGYTLFYKNGTLLHRGAQLAIGTGSQSFPFDFEDYANSTDFYEIKIVQSNGAARSLESAVVSNYIQIRGY
jgi:hypothetical protein